MSYERNGRGVSILVADSSGATGLSIAVMLHRLMQRVQQEEGLAEIPLVREYFDVVAGAGAGAITTTLVGRLGLTTEQAIRTFGALSKQVFSDASMVGMPVFKASKMEKALKDIVRTHTGDEDALMDNNTTSRECKTMTFAMSKHNMNAGIPTIFRSYPTSNNPTANCTIWQALRAATAHPEMFDSMEIEEHGISQPYVDAAMGCGNPIEHVLKEVKRIYPEQRIACVVSIGGGHARTIRIPDPSPFDRVFPTNVVLAVQGIATDNERAAQTAESRFQGTTNVYFRLNVDQGLQSMRLGDWDRLGEVKAHTDAYLQKSGMEELMKQAGKAIKNKNGAISTKYIDGEIQVDAMPQVFGIKECPAPTSFYTERRAPIERAIACLKDDSRGRRVFVFHGLGGAGKTQLALQTVEETREYWSDIIYVDATSTDTVRSALKGFAAAKNLGEAYEETIRWLDSYDKRWLMVFDNADDTLVKLRQYFPKSAQGRILITTRSRELVQLAVGPSSEYNVSDMEPDEATRLLLKVARKSAAELSREERDAATSLVHDLGFLALGVVQAGAYIWRTSCGFAQYRDIYAAWPEETLESFCEEPVELSGYEKTVYRTWRMSYDRLSERAQKTLWLLTYLQRDRISQEMFQRAATRAEKFTTVLPLTETEGRALNDLKKYLSSFLDGEKWNSGAFLKVMAEIMEYSLISYDSTNRMYVLHILVQNWTHTVIPYSPERALAQSSFLLGISINREGDTSDYNYRRSVELHVSKAICCQRGVNQHMLVAFADVMQENGQYSEAERLQLQAYELHSTQLEPNAESVVDIQSDLAATYRYQGQYKQAEALQVQVLKARKQVLGDQHPHTLSAMANLANTYLRQGQYKKAETLQVQVLEARKQVLGDQHPDTLSAMANLANTYLRQGQYKQAETLQVQVLEARKRVLGDQHPDTLSAMANLANTYSDQGQYKQAETLQVQVLEARKRVLDDQHPHTLSAMANLANTYSDQGQHQQAETLQVQVLEARKQVLGDQHPDTLSAMANLAVTYSDQGQYKQAETLQVQVLEARKRVLGDQHPDTLTAMANLAITYSDQGQYKQAETLEVQVLEARKRVLDDQHPHTLSAMANLANTYSDQGQHQQAETLQVQVLEARKRVLGDQHPDTLTAMANLAITYSDQGQYKQAETLEVQVLEARKQVLGDQHPHTLSAMNNLANTYSNQGQHQQAETLQVQVLEARKRVLGDQHPDTLSAMANLANTYSRQGQYKQAETLEVQVLEARKRVLGDQHPDTLTAMANLAVTYLYQGQYKQAETLEVQVLEARKQVLGDQHPDTLTAMANLAITYSDQGQYKQAETLEVQVLEARKRVLGDQHPDILSAMANLANTYSDQGQHQQAETLEVQVLEARKRVLGDQHLRTLSAMANLAVTYWHQGQYNRAETIQVQVLEASKRVLGDQHPDTLRAKRNLAITYKSLGRSRRQQYQALKAEINQQEPPRPSTRRRILDFFRF